MTATGPGVEDVSARDPDREVSAAEASAASHASTRVEADLRAAASDGQSANQPTPNTNRAPTLLYATLAIAASNLLLHRELLFSQLHVLHGDPGDTRFLIYTLEHTWAFITGRAPLFDAPFFTPAKNVMAYSDLMLGVGPLYWPFRALGIDRDPAFALFTLLVTSLDALTFFLLLRRGLSHSPFASMIGAVFFAAGLPRANYTNHPQLLPMFFPALAIWAAIELYKDPKKKLWLAVLVGALALQLWTAYYTAWFTGFSLAVTTLVACCFSESRARIKEILQRGWPVLLLSGLVAGLILAPLALRYLEVARTTGSRSWGEVGLPRIQTFLNVGDSSWFYGWTSRLRTFQQIPVEGEHRGGIGFVTTAVLLFTLFRHRRSPGLKVLAVSTIALILLTVLWRGGWSPWRIVFAVVPGANAIRAMSRFAILLIIPGAIALATFADEPKRRPLVIAIALFSLVEQLATYSSFDTRGPRANVAALTAAIPPACHTFLAMPAGSQRPAYEIQLDAMFAAYDRNVQTVNGYSGKTPPGYELETLQGPDLDGKLSRWATSNGLTNVCTVKVAQ